ncbi:MAG: DNRLRE domain-containing protein [Verrucomicrobia bacterium]|nr:DNRLRE domain-containing protein [Verrucomicrobiota bacterium]
MKAISLRKEQAHTSFGKLLFRLLKILALLCVMAVQPQASQAAGVTIITHGFRSDTIGWVDEMFYSMVGRQDFPGTDYTACRVNVTRTGQGNLTVSLWGQGGHPLVSDSGEIFVLLDWSDIDSALAEETSTTTVAETVVPKLLDPTFLPGLNKALLEFPIHLVGHSRGGSLLTGLARLLGERGIIVDQVTTLDPHPVDWVYPLQNDEHAPGNVNRVAIYNNVVFADNYYRNDSGTSGGPDGFSVVGAANIPLTGIVVGDWWNTDAHTDVHTYYHGTINSNLDFIGPVDGRYITNSWYEHPGTGPREEVGYCWSRKVGNPRPLEGISSDFVEGSGGANRVPLVSNGGPQWPNVIIKTVPNTTVTVGSTLGLSCWYRDTDSSGNIAVYLDLDRNPYNNNSTLLTQASSASYAATSSDPSTRSISANTAGVTPNTYYLCLKITDSTGLTRYDYWLEPIVIAPIGVLVQTSPNDQGLDFTVDTETFDSAQTFQWQDGISHNISVVGYQTGDNNAAYGFKQWSDGITTVTRSVEPSGNVTYTAIFTNSTAAVLTKTVGEDAFIDMNSPSTPRGGSYQLLVRNDASQRYETLLRFDLSAIPVGSTVNSVTLNMIESGAGEGGIGFCRVTQSWDEDTVTWNNQPSREGWLFRFENPLSVNWSVTSAQQPLFAQIAQGWVNSPSANYGMAIIYDYGGKYYQFSSKEHASDDPPSLTVHYTPPPDTTGDPIVNLIAKKSSTGSTIAANNWQHDNDPYFSWATSGTVMPVVGYSFALDNPTPPNTVNVTVPYYQYSSDSISDELHTFYVKSLDANGNWGPVASFVIKVDANPPTSGTISINNGANSTWSSIVTLNNLGANATPSGLDQMKFSNDGSSWTSYESYASTKTGWDLFSSGGNTNIGTKTVYVRYMDKAGNESAVFFDTIVYTPAPAITSGPQGTTLTFIGGKATLSVAAEGEPPLAYNWKFNGIVIPDETNSTLALTNLQLNQSGLYSVTVSNLHGRINSAELWLEVSPVVAWGRNYENQLNIPNGLTNVVALAGGGYHSLALRADGSVVAWGSGRGQANIPDGLSNVVSIAAGAEHSLALLSNSTVVAWGADDGGQLYGPDGLSNVVAIAAGSSHSLALKSDGMVAVWGSIKVFRGEGYEYAPYPSPHGLRNVISIASGLNHSLALRNDGTVFAWGNNDANQTDVPEDLNNVVAIAAGQYHSLVLKNDGTVVVWGSYDRPDYGWEAFPEPDGLSNVVAIAAGASHALALRNDGSVFAWGGQWSDKIDVPADLAGVVAIAGGPNHSLALIGTGAPVIRQLTVPAFLGSASSAFLKAQVLGGWPLSYQWQWNGQDLPTATNSTLLLTNMQLSQSGFYSVTVSNALGVATSSTNELTVVPVLMVEQPASQLGYLNNELTLSVVAQGAEPLNYQWMFNGVGISEATNQMLVLTNVMFSDTGDYFVVVTNQFGSTTSHLASIAVSSVIPWGYYDLSNGLQLMTTPTGLSNVVTVAAGQNHGLLLQSNGMVTAWGGFRDVNNSGEILPMGVPDGLSNVVSIAAGLYHSLALHDNGTVTAWGGYWDGLTNVPPGLSNVIAITGGYDHSIALRSDGTVVAWGGNTSGQLDVPLGLSNVVAISAGGGHQLALRGDGTVVAWGGNWSGQATVPVGLSNVVAIASGRSHSFALKNDGTTAFLGNFDNGNPPPPNDLNNIIAVACGLDYCLALDKAGTMQVWGSFYNSQNGDYLPIQIPGGVKNIFSLAAGETFSLALLGDGRPLIARQPIARTFFAGQEIVLDAMAGSVEPLSYQWQLNGTNIIEGTNTLLIINPARLQNSGYYSVIVSNWHGVVVGGPWLVAVSRPANDNFENRHKIASDFGITIGNNLDATKEIGESNHAGVAGGSSVWWTWTPSRAGTATITTDGSSFDTVLAVYTGGSVGALTLVAVDDDYDTNLQSKVTFPVLRGTPYHIAVDGRMGGSGNIAMTLSFEGPHLTEASVAGNAAQFLLNGPPGNPYQLQISSNLVDWVTISTVMIPESGSILLSDQTWSDHPKRFYRVTFDFFYGLVAYFPFEGNASDASGNGWNGNPIGPVPTTGVIGQAYYFDGQNDRISLPGSFLNGGLAQGTFACWILVESFNAGQTIFNRGVAAQSTALALGIEGSPGKLRGHINNSPLSLGNATLPLNKFVHTAITWDGTKVRYFLNGSLDLEIPFESTVPVGTSRTVDIGVDDQNVGWFHGIIDDVRIYNRAFSASAIHQLYIGQ